MVEATSCGGIVIFHGKILLLYKNYRNRYEGWVLPKGTVEPGETHARTLLREVAEETGLLVIPETIRPVGRTLELREDVFRKGQKYVCHTYFYTCAAREETVPVQMTPSEIAKGFHPVWETPEEIVRVNRRLLTQPWQQRDTTFITKYFGIR